MNHVGIFVYGTIVSLIVGAAYVLMVWASIADGRVQRAHERAAHAAAPAHDPSSQDKHLPAPSVG
jgi:hypothetical protein